MRNQLVSYIFSLISQIYAEVSAIQASYINALRARDLPIAYSF